MTVRKGRLRPRRVTFMTGRRRLRSPSRHNGRGEGGKEVLERPADRGIAFAAELLAVRFGNRQLPRRGIEQPLLRARGVVSEAGSQREREHRKQKAEDHHVPAGGLPTVHRFKVALQRTIPKRAQPSKLQPAHVPACLGESRSAEPGSEPAVKGDQFANLPPGGVVVGLLDCRKLDGRQEPFAVAFEKGPHCRQRIGSRRLDQFGQRRQRGKGPRGPESLGQRGDLSRQSLAIGRLPTGRGMRWNSRRHNGGGE